MILHPEKEMPFARRVSFDHPTNLIRNTPEVQSSS